MRSKIICLLFLLVSCRGARVSNVPAKTPSHAVAPLTIADRERIFDCVDHGTSDKPIALQMKSSLFSYFSENSKYPFDHAIYQFGRWPVLLSTSRFNTGQSTKTELIAFRGDTFGFHKSYFTGPLVSYAARQPGMRVVLPGEFLFVQDPARNQATIAEAPIMSLCHNRRYWFGYVGPEWPFITEYGWHAFREILLPTTKLHLFAYSNGTVSRNILLSRYTSTELAPYTAKEDPRDYLERYTKATQENTAVARVERLIDIEGNFRIHKELWDLLAFLKTRYLDGGHGVYYAIVRMDKPDAFPVNVLMIRALGLKGVENDLGIIRYSNYSGNIVIDVVTRSGNNAYRSGAIDLKRQTSFVPAVRRNPIKLNHYSLIDFALAVYERDFPYAQK